MIDKNISRLRRAAKTRATIARLKAVRMTVHRTNSHIYAQVIDAAGVKVLASASSAEKEVRGMVKNGGNKEAATLVGKRIAELTRPHFLRIGGYWYPRGGIPIDVFWQTGRLPDGVWLPDQGVAPYRGRG